MDVALDRINPGKDLELLYHVLQGDDAPPYVPVDVFAELVDLGRAPLFYTSVWKPWAATTGLGAAWRKVFADRAFDGRVYRQEDFERFLRAFAGPEVNSTQCVSPDRRAGPGAHGPAGGGVRLPVGEPAAGLLREAGDRPLHRRPGPAARRDRAARAGPAAAGCPVHPRTGHQQTGGGVGRGAREQRGDAGQGVGWGALLRRDQVPHRRGRPLRAGVQPLGGYGAELHLRPQRRPGTPTPAAIERAQRRVFDEGREREAAYETASPLFWLELADVTKRFHDLYTCGPSTPSLILEARKLANQNS